MRSDGLRLFDQRNDEVGYSVEQRNLRLSDEYEAKIKANPAAWSFFSSLAPSYRRESVWWVMIAKRPETQANRLDTLIACSEAALKIPNLRKK